MPKTQTQLTIRPREPTDDTSIAAVVAAAFRGEGEIALVKGLRRDGDMVCELVAVDSAGDVVGHIAFSRLDVRASSRTLRATALAPLAVAPKVQRQGIGDALTRAGLAALKQSGEDLVVVLGHPAYYPRFGFSSLIAKLLDAPYAGESFMALELRSGAIDAMRWKVTYARAFSG